jgi:DNA invertase Pin-like site-specific DNA recombinase
MVKERVMAKLGYARVSTNQQKLDIQIKALKAQGVRKDRIFSDKASGKNTDRPGLQRLLDRAEDGDEVLVTKLDRLGRNTLDMITIVEELHSKEASVTFIDDKLTTAGDMGYMLITILSAVAQAERARILERTNEGREAAMEQGIQFGRKPHKGSNKALKMIKKGMAAKEVIESAGISRATYFRLKKSA